MNLKMKKSTKIIGVILGIAILLGIIIFCIIQINNPTTPFDYDTENSVTITKLDAENYLKDRAEKGWKTERLTLSKTTKDDINSLAPMLMDYDVSKFITLYPLKFNSEKVAKDWLTDLSARYPLIFTVKINNTGEIIGQVGFDLSDNDDVVNILYWIGADYQKKGYAYEATNELTKSIISQEYINGVEISFITQNTSSNQLATKILTNIKEKNPNLTILKSEDWRAIFRIDSSANNNRVCLCELNSDFSNKYFDLSSNEIKEKANEYKVVNKKYLNKNRLPDEYTISGEYVKISKSTLMIVKDPDSSKYKGFEVMEVK